MPAPSAQLKCHFAPRIRSCRVLDALLEIPSVTKGFGPFPATCPAVYCCSAPSVSADALSTARSSATAMLMTASTDVCMFQRPQDSLSDTSPLSSHLMELCSCSHPLSADLEPDSSDPAFQASLWSELFNSQPSVSCPLSVDLEPDPSGSWGP